MNSFDDMCSSLFKSYAFKPQVNDVKVPRASVLRQFSGRRDRSLARSRFMDCILELAEIAASEQKSFIDVEWLAPGSVHQLHDHGFNLQKLANEMIRISW